MNLKDLTKEIPYQWRVQSFSKYKAQCTCVAYIDARDVMRLLDEVVGACNWQDDYKVIHEQMFAGIGIKCGEEWVWKWDTGTESQTEKEKGIVSDSFKRSAVKWGVGRFLYDLPMKYLKADQVKKDGNYPYPVDDNNNRIWDVTEFINKGMKSEPKKTEPQTKPETISKECKAYMDKINCAKTKDELKTIGTELAKDTKLTANDKDFLRNIYSEKDAKLK